MTATDRTLLGHLLIERNLISREQLDQAIRLQKLTQRQLGQILVEQNLISERQIRRLLRVQKRLRTTLLTSILSLTPFALQGCGGGAAAATEETSATVIQSVSQQIVPVASDVSVLVATPADIDPPTAVIAAPDLGEPTGSVAEEPAVPVPTIVEAVEESTSEAVESIPDGGIRIYLQPQSQSTPVGSDLTLNLSAEGPGILLYQWYRDGVAIPGAVLSSLTLRGVSPADSGRYHVRITSDLGTLESAAAELTVATERLARLRWQPPIEREDGSSLTHDEISGYRVYHAIAELDYETTYDVAPEELDLLLDSLPPGLHYFAISAIDANGLESGLSSLVSKRVL